MKEDLKKILLELMKWGRKYKKDYMTITIIDGVGMTSADPQDKDYKPLSLYIEKEENK